MKAIVTVGISGSGKSTFAEQLEKEGWVRVERDIIRRELFCFKHWGDYKFTKHKEQQVTDKANELLLQAFKNNKNVIVSDTNLNKTFRDNLITNLTTIGYEVEVKDFPIDLKTAIKRDLNREYSVGELVLRKQWEQWNIYLDRKKYIPDVSKPTAIICDIDGTIAKMVDRGPFEWNKVITDAARDTIISMVNSMFTSGKVDNIIHLSGRDVVCYLDTKKWMLYNGVRSDGLFMRSAGDMRPDTEVKEELFWSNIADNYNVVAVVDDRPCMIQLWYDLGIENVISVANPWVDF